MSARKPSAAPVVKRYAVRWHVEDPRPWLAAFGPNGASWTGDIKAAMVFGSREEARKIARRWSDNMARAVVHPAGREAARRVRD